MLLLQIAVILAASYLLGLLFHYIRQPRVIGEMTAGILLGPSLFGRIAPTAFAHLFPPNELGALNALSQIGLVLFLFIVGMEVQPPKSEGFRSTVVAASTASILAPLALGGLLAVPLHQELASGVPLLSFVPFIAIAMSITAFPVLARILTENNMLNTRAGAIAISCAAVDDVVGWCSLALLIAASAKAWAVSLMWLAVYGAVIFYCVRPVVRRFTPNISVALILLIASAWATETLGVHALFGAFVAGLVMPRKTNLPQMIEPVTRSMLLPLFFALTGLRMSIALIQGARMWLYCAAIIIFAISGKLLGCAFTLRVRGLSWRESLTVGALVNTRGLVELVVLNIGLDRQIISPALFSMMVLMALVTTFMTTPLIAAVNGRRVAD